MNKGELISHMASESGLTKADAERALNSFMGGVTKSLGKGDDVQLIGFGTFTISHRSARKGRNPQTGEEIQIKASKAPVFKASKALKETVNK